MNDTSYRKARLRLADLLLKYWHLTHEPCESDNIQFYTESGIYLDWLLKNGWCCIRSWGPREQMKYADATKEEREKMRKKYNLRELGNDG